MDFLLFRVVGRAAGYNAIHTISHSKHARAARCTFALTSVCYMSKKRTVTFAGSLGHHLLDIKARHLELSNQLIESDKLEVSEITRISKDCAELSRIVVLVDERITLLQDISELEVLEKEETARGIVTSVYISEGYHQVSGTRERGDSKLARGEIIDGKAALLVLEDGIVKALTPRDDADERGVVLEVRAGTGGDEASLFASDMFKMYQKYAISKGWRWEEMSMSKTDIGGFKEAQASMTGESVFKHMKYESGVHRVQRIPENDTRIQTSAVSVVVLPEAMDVDIEIRQSDLKIDVYRAGGAGGQSVNKTESAVRITHIPTGCVVAMQDERSQIQNRARAMLYLRARIYDLERKKAQNARQELRNAAQGTGDRSDKVRTYNFPQDRVTDHRVGVNISGVERVMNGESLSPIIDALILADEQDRLEYFLDSLEQKRKDATKIMKK